MAFTISRTKPTTQGIMLLTIEGVYENGQVTLHELPPFQGPVRVLVTFMEPVESREEDDAEDKSDLQQ